MLNGTERKKEKMGTNTKDSNSSIELGFIKYIVFC